MSLFFAEDSVTTSSVFCRSSALSLSYFRAAEPRSRVSLALVWQMLLTEHFAASRTR